MITLRVVDFETTGKEPTDEIVEAAITDVLFDPSSRAVTIQPTLETMFGASAPMSAEVRAVHHITDDMIAGRPLCTEAHLRLIAEPGVFAIVAHRIDFEAQWLTPEIVGDAKLICTYKAARRAYPEAPGFSNQALRYHFELPLDADLAEPPHRAGPDSYVTAHLLAHLLQTETVNDMVRWTREPIYYPTCTLNPHRGKAWSDIPHKFLEWMIGKIDDEDLKAAARAEIEARSQR